MKKTLMLCAVALMATSAEAVTVDVYAGFMQTGGGAPYSDLVGTFTSPDIQFGTATGFNWHPFDLTSFGAEITGCLNVAADDDYEFTLNSDDGSMLYIDDVLVVDNGGSHPPQTATGATSLTVGQHSFRVEFFEDFGGPSGVDLTLPDGVTYAPCVVAVAVDVKPGSCPNPVNVKDKGVLPVAILGAADFDVPTIDPASVRLEGVAPIRWALEDVATPVPTGSPECACTTDGPDGFPDLTLKFDVQAIVAALGEVQDGDVVLLTLTGTLREEFGGLPIEGTDCVIIKAKGGDR